MGSFRLSLGILAILMAVFPAHATSYCKNRVALALELGIDASNSADPRRWEGQIQGHVAAFLNPGIQQAILTSQCQRILAGVFAWSGRGEQRVLLPMQLLDSKASIEKFANDIRSFSSDSWRPYAGNTSLAEAVHYGITQLNTLPNGFQAVHKVLDMSGNGVDLNDKTLRDVGERGIILPPYLEVEQARAQDLRITINVLLFEPDEGDVEAGWDLEQYFATKVRTEDGFLISVKHMDDYLVAILEKFELEIAMTN